MSEVDNTVSEGDVVPTQETEQGNSEPLNQESDLSNQDQGTKEAVPEEEGVIPSKNWDSDKRYATSWNKDPNELYKSYTSLEEKLRSNGSKIKEYQSQVDELNNKSSEYNNLVTYLESMQKHPEYSNKLNELLAGYNNSLRRDAYGADLPDHIYDKLSEIDEVKAELESRKEQDQINEQSKIVDTQIEQINEIAKQYNIDYDRDEYINWCLENNVSPKHMKAYFIDHAFNYIKDAISYNTQNKVIKNINKNNLASLPKAKMKTKESNPNLSLREQLYAAID